MVIVRARTLVSEKRRLKEAMENIAWFLMMDSGGLPLRTFRTIKMLLPALIKNETHLAGLMQGY